MCSNRVEPDCAWVVRKLLCIRFQTLTKSRVRRSILTHASNFVLIDLAGCGESPDVCDFTFSRPKSLSIMALGATRPPAAPTPPVTLQNQGSYRESMWHRRRDKPPDRY